MSIIDSHQHFWDPQRGDYGWLTPQMTRFWQVFAPEDLRPELDECGVSGTVVVQAAPTDAECDYILEIAERTPWVFGVVGWLNVESGQAPRRIAALAGHEKFVGIRPMLQDLPNIGWIAQPAAASAFRALVEADLTFDALIRVHQAPHIAAVAEQHGDLAIVVDHAAKPDIAGSERPRWLQAMRSLASHPNVSCKLSGLLTEARPGAGADSLRFYFDSLLDIFGASRLLWGSDWPMVTAASDYRAWITLSRKLLANLSTDALRDVMGRNAIAFYGLETG